MIVSRQVGVYIGYAGKPLAHQIEAGADMFLMPSLYEPCGLTRLQHALWHGPDCAGDGWTRRHSAKFRASNWRRNRFKFYDYRAAALLDKIREALYFYGQPATWNRIQINGMSVDNSWTAAAAKYTEFYEKVLTL